MNVYSSDGSHLIVSGDPLQTLINCEGYYTCPLGNDGMPIGPIVGYTGDYADIDGKKKKYVGLTYFNFSKADMWPAVLTLFANMMVETLDSRGVSPTIILGAPWAGVKFSQEVAAILGCRHVFAEKEGNRIFLGRYEGAINAGDRVLIGEELVNNLSTSGKLCQIIKNAGANVIAIQCAINRSFPFQEEFFFEGIGVPIVAVVERETPQYRQDDLLVADAIKDDNVVWKPKNEWARLRNAMKTR